MIRALLDTNVLASAIVGVQVDASVPGELLRRWRRQVFTLVVSDHVLGELARTLANPYFSAGISSEQATRAIWTFRNNGELAPITVQVAGIATHPEDDLVLAAAISARVDYLVAGDRKLQNLGEVEIASPRTFLTVLDQHLALPSSDD